MYIFVKIWGFFLPQIWRVCSLPLHQRGWRSCCLEVEGEPGVVGEVQGALRRVVMWGMGCLHNQLEVALKKVYLELFIYSFQF